MALIFHADDFGITLEQSRRILDCSVATQGRGILNSVSVMTASSHFEQCCSLLSTATHRLRVGLHINLLEGPSLVPHEKLPLLTDNDGMFCRSYRDLLFFSLSKKAAQLKEELCREITAQLTRFISMFPELKNALCLDSHQHVHMIPLVFQVIVNCAKNLGLHIKSFRIPVEPFLPYKPLRILTSIKPINWPKHWLLNHLWRKNQSLFFDWHKKSPLFCGILFSGCMDAERVAQVSHAYLVSAQREKRDVEFLFHPGSIASPCECLDPNNTKFVKFYASKNRDREFQALKRLEVAHDRLHLNVLSDGVAKCGECL